MKIKQQINEVILAILASDINGCITGSCMLNENFDDWREVPDVDIFAYNEQAFTYAIAWIESHIGDIKLKDKADIVKREEYVKGIFNRSRWVETLKWSYKDISINLSVRKGQDSVADIITRFDLSCIMKGQDIRTGTVLDLTGKKEYVTLNPYRELGLLYWDALQWIRQWDRVVKYWERGFYTVPAAWQYRMYIADTMSFGNPFNTEKSAESFANAECIFADILYRIDTWLLINDPDGFEQYGIKPTERSTPDESTGLASNP